MPQESESEVSDARKVSQEISLEIFMLVERKANALCFNAEKMARICFLENIP